MTFELNLDRQGHVRTHAAKQTHGQPAQRSGDRLLTVRSRLAQSEVAVHALDLRSHRWQQEMHQGDRKQVTAFLVPGSTSSYLQPVCQPVEARPGLIEGE